VSTDVATALEWVLVAAVVGVTLYSGVSY